MKRYSGTVTQHTQQFHLAREAWRNAEREVRAALGTGKCAAAQKALVLTAYHYGRAQSEADGMEGGAVPFNTDRAGARGRAKLVRLAARVARCVVRR
jgi:hypothetical protein